MKIVILVRALSIGGAERQAQVAAAALASRGHDVALMTFYDGGNLLEEAVSAGVRWRVIGKQGRWDIIRFMSRSVRAIALERCDALYSMLPGANLVALLAGRLGRVDRLVLGVRATPLELNHYGRLDRLIERVHTAVLSCADAVIFNSDAALAANTELRRKVSCVVVPNGIDVRHFVPDAEARHRQRALWGVGDAPTVGIVGRLDPMKDHETFLHAAALLMNQIAGLRVAIVGDGPQSYRHHVSQIVSSLGLIERVVWQPAVPDPVGIYCALDVVVSSSSFGEGFSNVVAEAMSCGRPVVCTDVGEARRIIGDAGWLVSVRESRAMAEAIREAIERGGEWSDRARARIAEHFSVADLGYRTERALEAAGRVR